MLSRARCLLKLSKNVKIKCSLVEPIKLFHDETKDKEYFANNKVPGTIKEKYSIYKESDAVEVLDIEEQKLKDYISLSETHIVQTNNDEELNLKRGLTGVYDIEELVEVLERENAENIFVCPIAPDLNYVDYMCIVTGKSYRHMLSIAQYVRKIYKKKRDSSDVLPKIEGEDCQNWMAMDLGNIALHIFSQEAREKYDLETLWTLGPEFDNESNKLSNNLNLYEEHKNYLNQDNNVHNFKT